MTSKPNTAAQPTDTSQTTEGEAANGVANPPAANSMDSASGAIIEPVIKDGVDMAHPAIDNNPREGTSAAQNARDMNDPNRRKPHERDFAGQGIDPTPYGRKAELKKSKAKKSK